MRKAFIAFGILTFLFYCWASVAYQNQIVVPDYKPVEVDLLGGLSRAEWDAKPQIQFQRLMELEGNRYQLPIGAPGDIPPDRALTSDDFARFIAETAPDRPVVMNLRDTSAFRELLARNYLLRDTLYDPDNPDGPPLYMGGHPLDKEMLDNLNRWGHKTITVTGNAAPVGFRPGTAVMVAVIFLTLSAALKPLLWDPFMVMLEKRRRELEMGTEAERQNQLEAVRFADESRRRNAELYRQKQELRMKGEGDIVLRTGEIVKAARAEEKKAKAAGLNELNRSADAVREALRAEIPELAEIIAETLSPGRDGPRWDVMVDKES